MILREYVRAVLDASTLMNEALEAHILNFYEDLDMGLGELYEVIDAIRDGALEEVTEKMDGQNVTFTVLNGELHLFSKGATWARVMRGGLTRDSIIQSYDDRPTVRDAFLKSYKAIQAAIDVDPQAAAALFMGGQVVVESSIQMPGNPNTIVYDSPSIQFIQAVALGPDVEEVNQAAYQQFIQAAQRASKDATQDVDMGLVPYLKLQKSLDNDDALADQIKSKLDSLLSQAGMKKSNTIGDLAVFLTKRHLEFLGNVPEALLDKAAMRIGTGNKKVLDKRTYVSQSSLQAWQDFQALEKRRSDIVAEALIPLEKIVQLMGVYAFRNLEFAIASNTHESGEALRAWVAQIRQAFARGHVLADPKTTDRIRIALARIGDQEEFFEKAVEGIVFRWKGKTRKLTGLFTPINKLRGFFAYGNNPATVQSESRRLQEGGNAFKTSDGESLTVDIPKDRVRSTLDHFAKNVLDNLSVTEYAPIGSTGKKAMSGDLDIAIPVPAAFTPKEFKASLLKGIQKILGKDHVRAIGSNLTVAYPIVGSPSELVQIDIMLTSDLRGTTWLMQGHGNDRIKGAYRNLLLAYVAKQMGESLSTPEETVKFSISFPGGLMVKKNGKEVMDRISDPDMILNLLGLDVSPSEVGTFEDLADVLRKHPQYGPTLDEFPAYISFMIKKDPDNAKRAVEYIQNQKNESLRAFIRSSLRG